MWRVIYLTWTPVPLLCGPFLTVTWLFEALLAVERGQHSHLLPSDIIVSKQAWTSVTMLEISRIKLLSGRIPIYECGCSGYLSRCLDSLPNAEEDDGKDEEQAKGQLPTDWAQLVQTGRAVDLQHLTAKSRKQGQGHQEKSLRGA